MQNTSGAGSLHEQGRMSLTGSFVWALNYLSRFACQVSPFSKRGQENLLGHIIQESKKCYFRLFGQTHKSTLFVLILPAHTSKLINAVFQTVASLQSRY